jgi:transglutaminase superfamily protein
VKLARRTVAKLRRFATVSGRERALFAVALLLLPVARAILLVAGFRRAIAVFGALAGRTRPAGPSSSMDRDRLSLSTFRMVRAAARLTFSVCKTNCLPQALVTRLLLQRQGLDAALRFGARKHLGKFEAHAWLQLDSMVLDSGGHDAPYAPFTGR